MWVEFSGARKSLDVDGIMDWIVEAFPDVEFIYPESESDGHENTSEKDDGDTDWHDLPWE